MIEFIISHWWLWIIGIVTGFICYIIGAGLIVAEKPLSGIAVTIFGYISIFVSWICIIITVIVEVIKYAVNL